MTINAILQMNPKTVYRGCFPCARVEDPIQTMARYLINGDKKMPTNPILEPFEIERLNKKLSGLSVSYQLSETDQIKILVTVATYHAGRQYKPVEHPISLAALSTQPSITQHLGLVSRTMMGIWIGTHPLTAPPFSRPISPPPFVPSNVPTAPPLPVLDQREEKTTLGDLTRHLETNTQNKQAETRRLAMENYDTRNQQSVLERALDNDEAADNALADQQATKQDLNNYGQILLRRVARGNG